MTKKKTQPEGPLEAPHWQEDEFYAPEEHIVRDLSYPVIQFWNGGREIYRDRHPLLAEGCFLMTMAQFRKAVPFGDIPDGWTQVMAPFDEGRKPTDSIITNKLQIAPLATRFAWESRVGKQKTRHFKYDPELAGVKIRGRFQLVGYLRGIKTVRPVMITARGMNTDEREDWGLPTCVQRHRSEIILVASSIKGIPQPNYAFYLPLCTGKVRQVGVEQRSAMTPIIPDWAFESEAEAIQKLLQSLAVPSEAGIIQHVAAKMRKQNAAVSQDEINQMTTATIAQYPVTKESCAFAFDDAKVWADKWRDPKNWGLGEPEEPAAENTEPETEATDGAPPEVIAEGEIPF